MSKESDAAEDAFLAAAAERGLRRVEWNHTDKESGTMVLLVRNRVKDIEHWKKVFDEQEAAGLSVKHV